MEANTNQEGTMFTLKIETSNAAFEDGPDELARLVEYVAQAIRNGQSDGTVRDFNGNTVGSFATS
jgi:hypothetical protein